MDLTLHIQTVIDQIHTFPIQIVSFCSCELSSVQLNRIFNRSTNRPRFLRNDSVSFRREGLSSRKKISFGVVAMATWLELSIYKLVFCILPLANISFSPHLSLASLYLSLSLSLCLKHTITLPLILSNSLGIESTPPLILLGSSSKLQCFGIIQDPKTSVLLKWHRYVVSNFITTSSGVFASHEFSVETTTIFSQSTSTWNTCIVLCRHLPLSQV